ncbi:neuroendocrine convertase 1-like isoform X1 [Haliotis asinina]|uniref:neuroendocrine convertase 1-like isoform X1 n=1 Tax=Haliotis asinina TaxID=109174 RepID=UPI003531A12D
MTKGVVLLPLLLCIYCVHNVVTDSHFVNEWAAQINGGYDEARRVAEQHGYEIVREVRGFDDHYLLRHNDVPHRSRRSADHHTKKLTGDHRVEWAEQQESKVRSKRGYLQEKQYLVERAYLEDKRATEDRLYRNIQKSFNDPMFKDQWYLRDDRKGTKGPKVDLHVMPVWSRNITGRGVVVTILDDGIERNHTDLVANYDPMASTDLNGNDTDPMPRYDPTNENKHGTRCAGEVAMAANNGKCGVGVAFNANIGGVRMLDGKVTDVLEGEAIQFNHKYVDIYSASWGPNDDGLTVEGPGKLAKQAFERGVKEGRNGKGVIYVWASGNGGHMKDNCDCDGYTGSIYSISISSASQAFEKPWYGERCASTMATTYSSGSVTDKKVVSTDLRNKCTDMHTGTSAAAPLAAGIFALLLEANPNLTWRDVQHLVAWTSQSAPLEHNKGWQTNGAGFLVNTAFGFGLLDATGLVDAADPSQWETVPESFECKVEASESSNLPRRLQSVEGGKMLEVEIFTSGCVDQDNEINFLEHVILTLSADYTKRGDLSVYLVSPEGTRTTLLFKRTHDRSSSGYKHWPLMSVHTWGESPRGTWRLIFEDTSGNDNYGSVNDVSLTMYGTKVKPQHMRNGPRKYNPGYNQVKNEKKRQDTRDEGNHESKSDNTLAESLLQLRLKLLSKMV